MKATLLTEISEIMKLLELEEKRCEQDRTKITDTNSLSTKDFEEHYTKIKEILEVIPLIKKKANIIDEIVFKTQLLSFNASIEAERAGENGRGFSVVAQEIGNLAQTSGAAASDISELIKSSIKKSQVLDLNLRTHLLSNQKAEPTSDRNSEGFILDIKRRLQSLEDTIRASTFEIPRNSELSTSRKRPQANYPESKANKDEFWPATAVNHRSTSDDPWEKIK